MGTRPTSMRQQPVEDDSTKNTEVMDPIVFTGLKQGKFSALQPYSVKNPQPLPGLLNKSTPSGNSALHVAAGSPHAQSIVELLATYPDLLVRTNNQEDTPLHESARTGNTEAIKILLKCAQDHKLENFLMKKKNKKGNTALHNAVIGKYHSVAQNLIKADPSVAYIKNAEVKSPLYLAAENGDRTMLRIIMEAVPEYEYPISGVEGKSPANAAVQGRNLEMLRDMAHMKPELLRHKDEKKEIPLHFASREGYFDGVEFLLEKYSDGAFERNRKGLYPIHVACRSGHIVIVDRLLKVWPDPMELLTANGQTVLHVSAEKGRENVVAHLLKNHEIVELINEKDEDGNTALHLAAMRGRSRAVYSLVMSNAVDWKIVNNENMAAFEVVEQQIKKLEEDSKDEKYGTKLEGKETKEKQNHLQPSHNQKEDEKPETKLEANGMEKKQNLFHRLNYFEVMMSSAILHFHASHRKGFRDYLRFSSKPLSKEETKSKVENLLVVAILVASVTFAGAIQIPGGPGGKSGGGGGAIDSLTLPPPPPRPSPTASGSDALLKIYIYLDVLALNTAIMASLVLCWAKITAHLIWLASILIGLSIYLMCLAFVFAAAIAVSENVVTFSVLILFASLLFMLQTIFCLPLIIPPNESKAVEKFLSPYIYYGIFGVNLLFQNSVAKLHHDNNNHHNHHRHHYRK